MNYKINWKNISSEIISEDELNSMMDDSNDINDFLRRWKKGLKNYFQEKS